jgi:hypothetical protein
VNSKDFRSDGLDSRRLAKSLTGASISDSAIIGSDEKVCSGPKRRKKSPNEVRADDGSSPQRGRRLYLTWLTGRKFGQPELSRGLGSGPDSLVRTHPQTIT